MNENEYRLKNREFFEDIAEDRGQWKERNRYYYRQITEFHRFLIPEGKRILAVGSGDGQLLNELRPSKGLGIDVSSAFVRLAGATYPHLEFRQGYAEDFKLKEGETFDVVVLCNLVGHLFDVQKVFENIRQACHPSTRVVIHYYNYLWEPILNLGSKIGLRMKQPIQNWLALPDLVNVLHLSGFETIKTARKLLFPYYIPLISQLINRILANLPIVRKLCLANILVARPMPSGLCRDDKVSVVVACKNEKGNIESLVGRVPEFPKGSELIFVDGDSTDGTCDEILRMQTAYPDKEIRLIHQKDSVGKGHAVRLGFDAAKGDILMILDADLSVAPEELTKFYRLIAERRGEFVNGSRMIYPMEEQAMRFLNILGNKFFSVAFSYLLDQRIRDTLCGTKVLRKSDYDQIVRNRSYFGEFDPFGDFDLLFGAAKSNLKIVEVPVRYYERHYGVTKISRFRHGFLLLKMCGIALHKLKFV
jgi:SAM-dependent methyltransferase